MGMFSRNIGGILDPVTPDAAPALRPRTRPRWGGPLLATLLIAQIVWGGANNGLSSAVASGADALVAIAVLVSFPVTSRVWHYARWPFSLLGAALLWAALPAIVPRGLAHLLAIPPNPAADLFNLEIAKALGTMLLLITAMVLAYRAGSARGLVRWLTLLAMAYTLYAVIDAIDWLTDTARAARYSGTIGNPNAAGIVFAAFALLAGGLAMAPDDEPAPMRLAALASSAVALVLCALTGSRSAVLLALLFGSVLLIRRWRRWQDGRQSLRVIVPATIALLMLVGAVAIATPVANRSSYLPEDAGLRWAAIEHFAAVANQSPVWGHGLGSFFAVNQQTLTTTVAPLYWNFGAAHNAPVQVAIEAGWPALALLIVALVAIATQIFAARRDWWSIAPLCAIGAIGGSAMIDIALNVPAIAALCAVLVGVVWGAALRTGRLPRRAHPQRKAHRHRRTTENRDKTIVEPPV